MASGGDERGNLFQRTSSAIMYRNSDEDNEDETETANQNEKRLPPSPANNMNNQKNKAIPARTEEDWDLDEVLDPLPCNSRKTMRIDESDEGMASRGDERRNLFQRTSSAIMYRNSNEDNEDETETANQNEKRLPPSPANNMKNKAIPARTEEDWDLDEVLDPLPLNSRNTSIIQYARDINTVTGTMRIDGTEEDWDLDEVLDGLPCNIRTTNEIPYDERDITTVTGTMRINEIPVMLANDGNEMINTCSIDAVLMMILVMILVHPPLSTNLRFSRYVISRLLYRVFHELHICSDIGTIRRFWASLIRDYPGPEEDYVSTDILILEPLIEETKLLLLIEYRCWNNCCSFHRNQFQLRFSTLNLVQRYMQRCEMTYHKFDASIVERAIRYFICLPEEVDHRNSCPGEIITCILQPPPFFFLDVRDMKISIDNTEDLLGGIVTIQEEQYIISAMTIYNSGHPENSYGHHYNHMFIQQLNVTVLYDNQYGISMNCLNNQRRDDPQLVSILMLLRMSST